MTATPLRRRTNVAMVDPPPSHFFKFIPSGLKFNISIPKSFLNNLNKERGKKATLRRGGREWLVDVSDKGVFGDGWREFVTENGVQEFDFIVFKHQGNMMFDFLVFDQSTCERQYPDSFEDMDEEIEAPLTDSDSTHTHSLLERSWKLKEHKEDIFQDGDDHFVTILKPHHMKLMKIDVPLKFARSHGLVTNRIQTKIVIVDEAQRSWPGTLRMSSQPQVRLTGWRALKANNRLKAGDVCMFKIVKHGEVPVFNFYYLGKYSKSSSTTKKAISVTLKNRRCFTLTMKLCFKRSGMNLPVEFSMSNGLKVGEMVIRDDKGRSWKVELKKKRVNCLTLGSGFKAFFIENGLREGDVVKFELVENEKAKPPVMSFSCKYVIGADRIGFE